MDLTKFTARSPGDLASIAGYDGRHGEHYEHRAFVPHPLPDELALDGSTWEAIASAMQSLGRLDEASTHLPNAALLRRLAVRREAQSTSAIEGTWATLSELLEAEVTSPAPRSQRVQEVLNYVKVSEHAFEHIRSGRPLSVSVLCEMQRLLIRGTPADNDQAGKVRTILVVIGPENARVPDSRFVPPPPEHLEVGLRDWLDWMAGDQASLAKIALSHYQFETLHPFADGNGRLGRLIILLQLVQEGLLGGDMLPVSPWLENRREEYQDGLLRVSHTGEFDPWIRFLASGIASQAEATVKLIHQLFDLRARFRQTAIDHGISGVGERLAEDLIGTPIVTIPYVRDRYGITYMGAKHAVDRLVDCGLLTMPGDRKYRRVYANLEVIRTVEGITS